MADSRFDKVFTDPRFMVAPKKVAKVKIDKRFQGMFKEKEFNVVAKVDKYGKRIDKRDTHALQNYYHDAEEDSASHSENQEVPAKRQRKPKPQEEDSDSEDAGKKFYDSDGKFHWSGQSSSSDSEDEGRQAKKSKKEKKRQNKKQHAKIAQEGIENGEESDEASFDEGYDSASYSDNVSGVWSLQSDGEEAAKVAASEVIVGKRIAVRRLDWDSISAVDLLSLFQSFCQASQSMVVEKVEIYPSKFGKEQMERDILYGPPKEMFQKSKGKKMSRKQSRREANKEYMSDDDFKLNENDDGENMAQLRKYEVQKMDYFYAIVYCNSAKTATKLIEENQDLELELTNIRLNLYIVEDSLEFPYSPKQVAEEIPPNYTFDPSKVSRALNHSTVKLSWDQSDPQRASKLQSNYKKLLKKKDHEFNLSEEEEAYRDLIGSSSNSEGSLSENGEDADGGRGQARIEEMRQKLLGGLTEDKPKRKNLTNTDVQLESDDEMSEGAKEELQVNFGVGFGEDIGKKLLQKKAEKKEKSQMSEFQKWQEKRKDRKREKKQAAKDKLMQQKTQGKMSEKEVEQMTAEQKRQQAELDLLVGDSTASKPARDEAGEKGRDLRFVRDQDHEFAVDPTHKEYRKVTQGHNKVGKRRRKN